VPTLPENGADGKVLSLRERMEKHRANPVCAGCHRADGSRSASRWRTFDGVGRWRAKEDQQAIDATGTLFTGAKIDGISGLRREIAARPDVFRRRPHGARC
jgi:mono/diheme cytochrome c family protein